MGIECYMEENGPTQPLFMYFGWHEKKKTRILIVQAYTAPTLVYVKLWNQMFTYSTLFPLS